MYEVILYNEDAIIKIRDAMPNAFATAINKTANEAKTLITQTVRQVYRVKASDFSASYRLKRATPNQLYAILSNRRKRLSLPSFYAVQRKTGVSVGVLQGATHIIPHTFLATMKSGHIGVFVRRSKSRLPIRELKGLSPGQMMVAHRVFDKVMPAIPDIFYTKVKHEAEWQIAQKAAAQ